MEITLKYGTEGLPVTIEQTPGFQGVLIPDAAPVLNEPDAAVRSALVSPIESSSLQDIAKGRKNACIIISDITRPVPNPLLLSPILQTIEAAGIGRSEITILVATGMHRESTPAETIKLVGREIAQNYRIVDHHSKDVEAMVDVGKIGGKVPALVNRIYVEADLKILTGFIEPHIYAGYSGGRKSILPGISSIETLRFMHGPEMVADPGMKVGRLEGNPFHEAGLEVMKMVGADFIVNVTLSVDKQVTGVFAGNPVEAHLQGCSFLEQFCVRHLDEPLDFIITTNAGYPLDPNLYQCIKGLLTAAEVVNPGGEIVLAARCPEGPGSSEYQELLDMVDEPRKFLDRLIAKEFFIPDQWSAQSTYQVILKHPVWLYSDGFTDDEIRRYHFKPTNDVSETITALLGKYGTDAKWAVVPDGPMVILKIAGKDEV